MLAACASAAAPMIAAAARSWDAAVCGAASVAAAAVWGATVWAASGPVGEHHAPHACAMREGSRECTV